MIQEVHPLIAQLRPGAVYIYEDRPNRTGRQRKDHFLDYLDPPEKSFIDPKLAPTSDDLKKKVLGYTGEFTTYSHRNFSRAVDNLWGMVKPRYLFNPVTNKFQRFRLSSITLTLPPPPPTLTNKDITRLALHDFLTLLRNRHGLGLYVWKAELQKNFSIHYHLMSDLFIPKTQLQNIWNRIIAKYGILQDFQLRHEGKIAPSTRIDAVREWAELGEYLKKYTKKKPTFEEFEALDETEKDRYKIGKVYDCSVILQKTKYPTVHLGNTLDDFLTALTKTGKLERREDQYFTAFYVRGKPPRIIYPRLLQLEIKTHYSNALKTA
jgi:hypothetical protein